MLINKLLFEISADSKSVEESNKKMKKGATDVKSALLSAEKQTENLNKKIIGLAKGFMGLAAVAGLFKGVVNYANQVDQLDTLSKATRLTISDANALVRTFKDSGASADDASSSIKSMAKEFEYMNNPMHGILNLSNEVAGMSYSNAQKTLAKYGVTSKEVIDAMRKGSKSLTEIMRAQKKNSDLTQESVEKARAFKLELAQMKNKISDASDSLMSALIPVFKTAISFLSSLADWISNNQELVIGFFVGLATILASVYLPVLISTAAATVAATYPLILLGVAIAGVIALFMKLYKSSETVRNTINKVGQAFKFLYQIINKTIDDILYTFGYWVGMTFKACDSIINIFYGLSDGINKALSAIGEFFVNLFTGAKSNLDKFGQAVSGAFDFVIDTLKTAYKFIEPIIDGIMSTIGKVTEIWNTVKSWFGGKTDVNINNTTSQQDQESSKPITPTLRDFNKANATINNYTNNINNAKSYTEQAIASPAANLQPKNSMTTNNNKEQNISIGEVKVVTNATDSKGIAQNISNDLEKQISNINYQNNTAIEI